MSDYDAIEEFDDDVEDSDFEAVEEVAADAAPNVPPLLKQKKGRPKSDTPKAEKAEKAAPTHPKQVRVVAIGEGTTLYPMLSFQVDVRSVGNRLYRFTDPSKAVSWLTRRIYNGESVSAAGMRLKELLGMLNPVRLISRRMVEVDELLRDIDVTDTREWKKLGTIAKKLTAALEGADPIFSSLTNGITDFAAALETAAAVEVLVSKSEIENGEGAEPTPVSTPDFSARREALETVREAFLNSQSLEIPLSLTLDTDTPVEGESIETLN